MPGVLRHSVIFLDTLLCNLAAPCVWHTSSLCDVGWQVSFFRANLFLKVVKKLSGALEDGKPADKEALVQYIRSGCGSCANQWRAECRAAEVHNQTQSGHASWESL